MAVSLELLREPTILLVATPLLGAALALGVGRFFPRISGWISLLATATTLGIAVAVFVSAGSAPASFSNPLPWPVSPAPPTFYADVTSAGLILLASGLALCIIAGCCPPSTLRRLGFAFLPSCLALLGTIIAMLLSHDLLTFYLSWELTTLFAVLVILTRFDERSGAAATRFLYSSVLLGALEFFAVVWVGQKAGSFELSALDRALGSAPVEARWLVAATFVAAALFRGAIFPFHVWFGKVLQAAHIPGALLLFVLLPVTGFFTIVRLVLPHLPLETEWHTAIAFLGVLTALSGSAAALRPRDVFGVFAYLCVAQVGFVAIGLGTGDALGATAATFQLFGFGVSLTLFSLVLWRYGTLFGRTGVDRWLEFALTKPLPFTSAIVALLAVAALPPLGGFSARMLLAESLLAVGSTPHLVLLGGVLVATALGLAAVARLALTLEPARDPEGDDQPRGYWDSIPVLALAATCLFLGLASPWLTSELFARFSAEALNLPLQIAQAPAVPWTIAVAGALLLVSLGAGFILHVARSDADQVQSVPF
ncbi:MAG: hypothetical protein M1358_25615, partial [Chloroflexi bacterium]|nr:hypothetical protein [Chloroflexota bacterium]